MLTILKKIIGVFIILAVLLLLAIFIALSSLDYISDFNAFVLGVALGGVFAFSLSAVVLISLCEYIKNKELIHGKQNIK